MTIDKENTYYKNESGDFIKLLIDENGIPKDFISFKTKLAKQYGGYIMIKKDINLVIEAINALHDVRQPMIIQQSLLFYSIVTYGKCFIKNDGNRPSLEYKDIFKDADKEYVDEHIRIMDIRNDYVAHAGSKFDKCHVIGTIYPIGIDINSQLSYMINMPPKLEDFKRLCEYLLSLLEIKIQNALRGIFTSLQSLDLGELNKLITKPSAENMYCQVEDKSEEGISHWKYVKY